MERSRIEEQDKDKRARLEKFAQSHLDGAQTARRMTGKTACVSGKIREWRWHRNYLPSGR
jgi:hypothetical protein